MLILYFCCKYVLKRNTIFYNENEVANRLLATSLYFPAYYYNTECLYNKILKMHFFTWPSPSIGA